MKNLTFYKSVVAFATMTTMTLFSGCSSNTSNTNINTDENTYQEEKYDESCKHLTVYFSNEAVTFKECEGYDISASTPIQSGELNYKLYKNEEKILSGTTSLYNLYYVNHNSNDILIDEPKQKVK